MFGEAGAESKARNQGWRTRMTFPRIIAAAGFVLAAGAGCSSHHDGGMEQHMANADYISSGSYMHQSEAGQVMTTPEGMTVYTFDKDTAGTSACYGGCAEEWPPVTAACDAQPYGRMSIVARTDGTRQWAYDGKPLYLYDDDTKPGDAEGDGEHGVWHVVK
jgi:predicted lipoprotein with Yx(FWY)xxD motif